MVLLIVCFWGPVARSGHLIWFMRCYGNPMAGFMGEQWHIWGCMKYHTIVAFVYLSVLYFSGETVFILQQTCLCLTFADSKLFMFSFSDKGKCKSLYVLQWQLFALVNGWKVPVCTSVETVPSGWSFTVCVDICTYVQYLHWGHLTRLLMNGGVCADVVGLGTSWVILRQY